VGLGVTPPLGDPGEQEKNAPAPSLPANWVQINSIVMMSAMGEVKLAPAQSEAPLKPQFCSAPLD